MYKILVIAWISLVLIGGGMLTVPDHGTNQGPSEEVVSSPLPEVLRLSEGELLACPGEIHGEYSFAIMIQVAPAVTIPVQVEITSKGNGTMRIGTLRRRVYDNHDDGSTYVGRLLDIAFVDLDGDGFQDLVISGIFSIREDDQPRRSEVVLEVLMFDPKSSTFQPRFQRGTAETILR